MEDKLVETQDTNKECEHIFKSTGDFTLYGQTYKCEKCGETCLEID